MIFTGLTFAPESEGPGIIGYALSWLLSRPLALAGLMQDDPIFRDYMKVSAVSLGLAAVQVMAIGPALGSSASAIPGFSGYGALRAAERGFTSARIAKVLAAGKAVERMGRFGPQIRYTLGRNTVVIAKTGRYAGKIINTFSDQVVKGIKGYWVKP